MSEVLDNNRNGGRAHFPLDWPAWLGRFSKALYATVRLRLINHPNLEEIGPIIMAHWHGDDLCLLPTLPQMKASILVSQSRDGDILSRTFSVLGHRPIRGSSSRGGAAGLLAMKKALESGHNVALAADGPKGPYQVAKPGAAYLAAKTGRPLVPLGVAVSRACTFKKSWSKNRLALPGSRLVIAFRPPVYLPPEAARWPGHRQSRVLGAEISAAVREAELELERWADVRDRP
ncbi:MAG: lysophospholipid acyltransferase family protein [Candidatus Adiutrix sp.]|jgi:lysophospholipid acyltransferase (LPLAT)-like uncharacterized protein|nr:lysophospholipid acyltransferase family protein [Candidatus Adiutrix sp.]